MSSNIEKEILTIAVKVKEASRIVANLSTVVKNKTLLKMAELLLENKETLQRENKKDLEGAKEKGLTSAMIDRLTLTDKVIGNMAEGLRQVVKLEDPVGEYRETSVRPNGLTVGKKRIPLGVIGIIYESRPNVTADAAGLCLKSGNGVLLRGGSEAIHSNRAIAEILKKACTETGVPESAIEVVPITDRKAVMAMLQLEEQIDLIIPRGGESLISFVSENSRIPVIKHDKGVCHVYVDVDADLKMAEDIAFNAKVQRPGVCNSMESLLVHKDIAKEFLTTMEKRYGDAGVEVRGCEETRKIMKSAKPATDEDFHKEYLDLIISIKVVDSMDEAISHIEEYGSLHTESIITKNSKNAERFLKEVNSSTVMVNASTRFSDGFELGLGAEIGISTSKLHAFGPMGLRELTTEKFIVRGDGQIRE